VDVYRTDQIVLTIKLSKGSFIIYLSVKIYFFTDHVFFSLHCSANEIYQNNYQILIII
jgi:hypothetical protein